MERHRAISKNERKRLQGIASLGGQVRIKKYGNPGTKEGRILGGLRSIETHNQSNTGFKIAKDFLKPERSEELAEFMGIIIGDGHLSHYQLSITTNSETDIKHAYFIKIFIKKLFNLDANLRHRKNKKAVDISVSSVRLTSWLCNMGMPIGNKLTDDLSIPVWVGKNRRWERSFIRGLFDTDGSIYLDRHLIKGKTYENLGWTITSLSARLRKDILEILTDLGYRPTLRDSQRSIFLRRALDIERYFVEIGSHNHKHLERYEQFQGRVPKRS